MDFNELVRSRKSIRKYTEQDVSNDVICQLLDAARQAPSAGNGQPWHFYILKDKAVIGNIASKSLKQGFVAESPALIVVCADLLRAKKTYKERGSDFYCLQDTAAAIQNILLSAHELGLGTCWCGSFDEDVIKNTLNLPDEMRPVAIITVGYPNQDPAKTKRRSVEEISTFL